MAHHGLTFTAVVTSEDVGAYKPAQAVFTHGHVVIELVATARCEQSPEPPGWWTSGPQWADTVTPARRTTR